MRHWKLFIVVVLTISVAAPQIGPIISATYSSKNQLSQFSHPPYLSELFAQVNTSKIEAYLEHIEEFGPHPTGSTSLNAVSEYLYNCFSSMNLSVTYDPWEYEGYSGSNIIATHPGNKSDEKMLLCAHYDTVDISPGADDDGSGIAAILMIAEILSHYSMNSTLQFLLFSGEEQGLLGSHEYVQEILDEKEQIIGVLALDKIGYADTTLDGSIIRHHADPASNWMIDLSQRLAEQYQNQIQLTVLRYPFDPSSDHKSFVDQGIAGSNLVEHALNPYYHTSEDILEHMNLSYLEKVTKLALAITTTLAGLNRKITSDDLLIQIKNTRQSEQGQFSVRIENTKHALDTANLSITIAMKHILRNEYVTMVKDYYDVPCLWNFTKEIHEEWEFVVSTRKYSRGFFQFEVSVTGINDDLGITKSKKTYGIVIRSFRVRMIAQL